MGAAADLDTAIAAARAVSARFHTATDRELLADVEAVEVLGRIVDGLRLQGAAQLQHRSRKTLGEEGLAFRTGARDGVQLVQHATGIGHRAAKQRVGLGAALAPKVALTGELLPGRYPELADAVADGRAGIEAARQIVQALQRVRRRAEPEQFDDAVAQLTALAAEFDADGVRDSAAHWAEALDPDGARPDEEGAHRRRSLNIGATRADGTTPMTVILTPEHLALVMELLQSRRRGVPLERTTPGGDDGTDCGIGAAGGSGGDEGIDPEWREAENPDGGDPRTSAQQAYDTLFETLDAGMRAEHDGTRSHAVTHEIVVTITADEIEARHGAAFAPGILAGIPIPTIERISCDQGVRLLVTGDDGEALHLSRTRRVFTSAQKKALTVAAGGRCQYPGCRTPSPFLEAHHAAWFHRDHGPTDVDNGVMLCSHRHHLIHAQHAPVEIRMPDDGDMVFVPRTWRGPYLPHQRRQRGPGGDPHLQRLRRRHDPARNPWRE